MGGVEILLVALYYVETREQCRPKGPQTLSNRLLNPLSPTSALLVIDFTLSNARQFYSSKGDSLGLTGLMVIVSLPLKYVHVPDTHCIAAS